MKHPVRHLVIAFAFCSQLTSCVSVDLGKKAVRSNDVRYVPPPSPFIALSLESADQAWRSKETGTTLSYLSICKDAADPELTTIRDSTLRGIEKITLQSEDHLSFNGREALKTKASGSLDGVRVALRLLNFKKNYCIYTISMVGLESKLNSKDELAFEGFLKGFVAP